jgi:NADH:ubiquinone oxidoreductase subunit E
MRKTAGCTWTNYKTYAKIAKELNVIPVLDKIQKYRRNWLQQTNKQNARDRLPRILKKDQ